MLTPEEARIGVIGLGYVGLPLAVAFGEGFPTVGFDADKQRIRALVAGKDHTGEVDVRELRSARNLRFSHSHRDLQDCNTYIVAVPTPVDRFKRPDFRHLRDACSLLGGLVRAGNVVVFESTVFPGATEELCVPIIEAGSGLVLNRDFSVGYSPERINPGDKRHRLKDIVKITSGSTAETAEFVDGLYRRVIAAGTHRVSSIRVAEAAKVIENTQRDVNIALVNELAMIFSQLGLDTMEVLDAAATKWNFVPFRPGLVGGHCVGVDPYYLTHKAQEAGYHPEMILAGRRINDRMGIYVAGEVVKVMNRAGIGINGARALVLGFAFKENCPDLRNTRVVDLVNELKSYGIEVDVHDPLVDPAAAVREYGLSMVREPEQGGYDAVVLAVAHDCLRAIGVRAIRAWGKEKAVLYDVKSVLPVESVDGRL